MGHFDALIVDEGQALQPQWIECLRRWLPSAAAMAFCDETQVFRFEAGQATVAQICAAFEVAQPYHLTIVLRMPHAVTQRLLGVIPPSYQISSPRPVEPDAIQELVSGDVIAALREAITQLQQQGLAASEIQVLVKAWANPELTAYLATQGIAHETVARFRGLESPAVIVMDGDAMDDRELFCAYSRATSVCIAVFQDESLGWRVTGSLQRSLLEQPAHQAQVAGAMERSQTRALMAPDMAAEGLQLLTVNLAWSTRWSAWLLQLDHSQAATELWIDYLVTQHPWPVYRWDSSSRRTLYRNNPVAGMTAERSFGTPLTLAFCEPCAALQPFDTCEHRACLGCCNQLRLHPAAPSGAINAEIRYYDEIMATAVSRRPDADGIAQLPLPLAAVGARLFASQYARRTKVLHMGWSPSSYLYRATLGLLQARIAVLRSGSELRTSDFAEEAHDRYRVLSTLPLADWQKQVSAALGTCFNKGYVIKLSKGRYQVVDDDVLPHAGERTPAG